MGVIFLLFFMKELTQREAEYVSLNRDTTESDLKQRREISSGSSYYLNQVIENKSNAPVFFSVQHCNILHVFLCTAKDHDYLFSLHYPQF